MKFELPQGLYMKAEAKDEESDDYRQNLNQTMNLRASTLPSMNVSMNMNQTMPLMDSEISLTVPMSRKNAAIITSTRLKRLKTLSSAKEEQLTGNQVVEKKRIIRLEKNRRAAAMSRKKKKVYIRDLEENSKLMERHLAILKMENDHLRALLSANMQQQAQQAQQMMAAQHAQSQQAQSQQGMVGRANSTPAPAPTTNPTSNPTQLIGLQAPPIMPPNPAKRRRLNDGSASTTASTAATSLNTSMDELAIDAKSESVEKQEMDAMPPPPPPPPHSHALNPMMHPMAGHAMHGMLNQSMPNLQRMRMMPNMFHGHQQMPQQMGQMPMHPQSHPQMNPHMNQMNPMMMAQMNANGAHPMPPPPQTMAQPQIQIQIPAQHSQQPKVEAKFDLKIEAMSEQKAESPDNSKLLPMPLPPSVLGAVSDNDDFDNEDFGVLPFLDESFIGETGDDGGFVI